MKHCYFEVLVDHKTIEDVTKCKEELATNGLTTLLLKLHDYNFHLKHQQDKKLSVSGTLSRLPIEANQGSHKVITLHFLQYLNTCIYHNYKHLVENVYKHKAKQQA